MSTLGFNPLNIIVALDNKGGFGKDGKLPWFFKDDFNHFKKITDGHHCIMGRATYEEIKDKKKGKIEKDILPGRTCWVLSKEENVEFEGATHAKSLMEAIQQIPDSDTIFVIGGEKLFIQALARTDYIYVTLIDKDYKCDKFFPIQVLTKSFTIIKGEQKKVKDTMLSFVKYQRAI